MPIKIAGATSGSTTIESPNTGVDTTLTTPSVSGTITVEAVQQASTGDGATTINWNNGNNYKFGFGAYSEVFTFIDPTFNCNLTLMLVQDSNGNRDITWPSSVKWVGGSIFTPTPEANGVDVISFYFDGTFYYGTGAGVNSAGASGGGNDRVFTENDTTVTTNYTITTNNNAMSAGPITVEDGVTVTVPDGSNWTIV